jgi:hypothetical protein
LLPRFIEVESTRRLRGRPACEILLAGGDVKFVAGPWKDDTRAGTFRRFFEAHADLDRAAFLERVKWPHLLIGSELDPRTWDRGVVLRVAPARDGASEVIVGRSHEGDLVLNCPTLSNRHASFASLEGKWFVTDLGSSTGTWVDGVRLGRSERRELAGDRTTVDLGPDVRAVFLTPEALHPYLAEARVTRPGTPSSRPAIPRVAGSEERAEWPTYSLLQAPGHETPTASDLPALSLPPGATPAPPKPPLAGAPPEPPRAPIHVASFWERERQELFGSRRKLVRTLLLVSAVSLVLSWVWRPLGMLLFAGTHPEWFR